MRWTVDSFGQCQMITGKENMTHVNTWRLTKETMINDNAWGERSPQFRTMPSDDWKRGHVRVHLEHVASFHDQSNTTAPGTDKDWAEARFIFATKKINLEKMYFFLQKTLKCFQKETHTFPLGHSSMLYWSCSSLWLPVFCSSSLSSSSSSSGCSKKGSFFSWSIWNLC